MKSALSTYLATVCLAMALGSLSIVRGVEPPCACPAETMQRMVKVWVNGNWVNAAPACSGESQSCDAEGGLLSKLPFIGRLMIVRNFTKAGEETQCDEKIELTGNASAKDKLVLTNPPVLHRVVSQICPGCKAVLTTQVATIAERSAECQSCACCKACACDAGAKLANCTEAPCSASAAVHCASHKEAAAHGPGPLELWKHIAQLSAEKAAAEARLAAREESQVEWAELYDAISELMADNAALDARLEAQSEHQKTVDRVLKLTAENARLKAEMQLATAKAEVMQQTLGMALENERLKLRIAQLEHQHALDEAARTASQSRVDQRSR